MKIRTAGKPQFKGDTFKRIEYEVKPGVWHTVFGVNKQRGMWVNDTYSAYEYKTLTAAKEHAEEIITHNL